MDELSWSLQQFGQVVASYALELEGVSQVRARSVILKFVDAARAPAIRVGELGGKFEADAVEADRLIRQARAVASGIPNPASLESAIEESVRTSAQKLEELVGAELSVSRFVDKLQTMEELSVPLRRALRPMRDGVQKAKSAVAIVRSWWRLVTP